jgi:dihydrofolate reductase
MIKLIVAVDQTNAIGNSDGSLPWKCKTDMDNFKQKTKNGVVVMGRKTFGTLKRPDGLPNRINVVITRNTHLPFSASIVQCYDIDHLHNAINNAFKGKDIWVIGGAEIYKQFLDRKLVDEIHLSIINVATDASVKFPYNLIDHSSNQGFFNMQAELGVKWDIADTYQPDETCAFITIKKVNDVSI